MCFSDDENIDDEISNNFDYYKIDNRSKIADDENDSVMAREYRMFVRAVLDLLDERDNQDYAIATATDCDHGNHLNKSLGSGHANLNFNHDSYHPSHNISLENSVEQYHDILNEHELATTTTKPAHLSALNTPVSTGALSPTSGPSSPNLHAVNMAIASASSSTIIKAGPLRKASYLMRSGWKMKYVEVRKGSFSYYNDDNSTANNEKRIPLITNRCVCRAVKLKKTVVELRSSGSTIDYPSSAACFEISYDNGPKRLWMVHSKEERKSWLQAIHEAMIGRSVTRPDNFFEYEAAVFDHSKTGIPTSSPYRDHMEDYLTAQKTISEAKTKEQYLNALLRYKNDFVMTVPVEWVKNYFHKAKRKHHKRDPSAFIEEVLSSSVAQLWKDLQRDTVSINGHVYHGHDRSSLDGGAERIVGALARCIMDFDKSSLSFRVKSRISEIQSIAFARDILLACNRTQSSGDLYFCMETLCTQPSLVVLCPSSNEASPLCVEVCHVDSNDSCRSFGFNERKAWIRTRNGVNKLWERSFCILSETGTLSYYGEELPKPHRLKGQIILVGAGIGENKSPKFSAHNNKSISKDNEHEIASHENVVPPSDASSNDTDGVMKHHVLYIFSKNRGRELHLSFDCEVEFNSWIRSLRKVIERYNDDQKVHKTDSLLQATADRLKKLKLKQLSFSSEVLRPYFFDVIRRDSIGTITTKYRDKKSHMRHRSLPGFSFFDAKLKSVRNAKITSQENHGSSFQTAAAENHTLSEPCSNSMNRCTSTDSIMKLDSSDRAHDVDNTAEGMIQNKGVNQALGNVAHEHEAFEEKESSDVDVDVKRSQLLTSIRTVPSVNWSRHCPTVRVNVRVSSSFKICTIDPDGSDEDTWANVNMTFSQHFMLRGGSHGKIVQGEELAQVDCCSPSFVISNDV